MILELVVGRKILGLYVLPQRIGSLKLSFFGKLF